MDGSHSNWTVVEELISVQILALLRSFANIDTI